MENHLIYIDSFTTALDKTSIGLSAASLLKTFFFKICWVFFSLLSFVSECVSQLPITLLHQHL